jgi:hypothetical protein
MKMKAQLSLSLLLLLAAPLATLHAQGPTKIFVASFGSDANEVHAAPPTAPLLVRCP